MSHGVNLHESWRRSFVDKILKGAKPGDLPVEQPSNELVISDRRSAEDCSEQVPIRERERFCSAGYANHAWP
jgi:putative ABC transport system substrate-binding protein